MPINVSTQHVRAYVFAHFCMYDLLYVRTTGPGHVGSTMLIVQPRRLMNMLHMTGVVTHPAMVPHRSLRPSRRLVDEVACAHSGATLVLAGLVAASASLYPDHNIGFGKRSKRPIELELSAGSGLPCPRRPDARPTCALRLTIGS